MSTKTTSRATGTLLLWLGCLLAVGGVVLAVAATQVSYGVTRQRESTCNGLIPMPTSAFALGWVAVAVAVLATIVLLIGRRARVGRSPSAIVYDVGRALLGAGAVVGLLVGIVTGLTAAFLLAVAGALGVVGASVAVVTARRRRDRAHSATSEARHPGAARALFLALLTAAALSLLFDGFVLVTVYQDAPVKAHVCFG